MSQAARLTTDICDYYLKQGQDGQVNIPAILKLADQDKIQENLNAITFYATMHNQHIKEAGGFANAEVLKTSINELMTQDQSNGPEEVAALFKEKVNEF